jgi:hypothetical protein
MLKNTTTDAAQCRYAFFVETQSCMISTNAEKPHDRCGPMSLCFRCVKTFMYKFYDIENTTTDAAQCRFAFVVEIHSWMSCTALNVNVVMPALFGRCDCMCHTLKSRVGRKLKSFLFQTSLSSTGWSYRYISYISEVGKVSKVSPTGKSDSVRLRLRCDAKLCGRVWGRVLTK